MPWILIDLLLVLLALALLGLLGLRLFRQVKALSRTVSTAAQTVGHATEQLAVAQSGGPLGAGPGGARPDVTGRSPSGQR